MASSLQIPISSAILIYLLSLVFLSKTHLSVSDTDIHDLLPDYGLPRGILPDNVDSYNLSPSGSISVQLNSSCYVHFEDLVYYHKQINGNLSYGAVHDVSGIEAKKFFLWLPVSGIEASESDGMVKFFVGALSKKFPAAQFEDIPSCESKVSSRANLDSM